MEHSVIMESDLLTSHAIPLLNVELALTSTTTRGDRILDVKLIGFTPNRAVFRYNDLGILLGRCDPTSFFSDGEGGIRRSAADVIRCQPREDLYSLTVKSPHKNMLFDRNARRVESDLQSWSYAWRAAGQVHSNYQRDVDCGGCDPLALVDGFTPVEDNIGLLEARFDVE
ncbi:hypothetical protein Tco_0524867, partial [Tanacetum coccineum]